MRLVEQLLNEGGRICTNTERENQSDLWRMETIFYTSLPHTTLVSGFAAARSNSWSCDFMPPLDVKFCHHVATSTTVEQLCDGMTNIITLVEASVSVRRGSSSAVSCDHVHVMFQHPLNSLPSLKRAQFNNFITDRHISKLNY